MLADISMAVMAGLLIPVDAPAQPPSETPQVYVQLIVKACPADQPDVQADRPDAVRGYYAEAINQGKSYENERSPTRAEREAVFTAMHCIDVPVPPDHGRFPHQASLHGAHRLSDRDAVPAREPSLQEKLP